jgi:hypothetical protein
MFGLFEKKPESVDLFSAGESSKFQGPPPPSSVWLAWTADEVHLYRALVRELMSSKKIQAFMSGSRRADVLIEKVTHLINRYHTVHPTETPRKFRQVLRAAYNRGYGDGSYPAAVIDPLFSYHDDGGGHGSTQELNWQQWLHRGDYTGRDTATAAYYAGLGASEGLKYFKELDKVGGAATGGALSVISGARALRVMFKAGNRLAIAQKYAAMFPERDGGDFVERDDPEYMNQVLGFVAAYACDQMRRLQRRKATEAAGAGLSAAGAVATATGVGAVVGIPLTGVGLVIGMETTMEEMVRWAWKKAWGTKGVARHEAATLLWLNGAANHRPTIDFMVEMGMLPVTQVRADGPRAEGMLSSDPTAGDNGQHFIDIGYFTPTWFDAAIVRIMRKLRTT